MSCFDVLRMTANICILYCVFFVKCKRYQLIGGAVAGLLL